MAYKIRFPFTVAAGLEQTWRFDKLLKQDNGRDYFDTNYSIIQNHEPLAAILNSHLQKNDLILEAGCGSGRWLYYLSKQGYRAVGLDISGEIISTIKKLDSNAVVCVSNVLTLPFRDNVFDAVLSSYVSEHFRNGPSIGLREAYRVLKPGGKLFFVVPFNNVIRKTVYNRLQDMAYYYHQPRDEKLCFCEYRFDRKECEKYLRQTGFTVECCYPDELTNGWNKGIAVDYRNLRSYWPFLPNLHDDFQLPGWAEFLTSFLQKINKWSCCGGIICVAVKNRGGKS
ncbi:MAG: class I SAM-dependent methyltransferase [Candidatus Zixiibacteriota bacterium]